MSRPAGGALEDAARFWRVVAALSRATAADTAIGLAPKRIVARREGVVLARCEGPPPDPSAAPLLVVHGLVGGGAIVDLGPDRSLLAGLVAGGAPVWTLDWGPPRPGLRWLAFEDLVLDHLAEAVEVVTRAHGARPVLLGVCEGGLFALCLAALAPRSVAGLALAVTPVDCHAEPDAALTRLVRAFAPAEIEALLRRLRGLPGGALAAAFAGLTPSRTLGRHTLGLLESDGDPAAIAHYLRMERWLAERPDHPEEAARQLLVEIYHENRLFRGAFRLDGRTVDLASLAAPTLGILGLRDHIVPPACARALGPLIGPLWRECALDAGHVGVFVSRRARGAAAAAIGGFLRDQAVRAASRVW